MKTLMSLALGAVVCLNAMALTACDSNNQDRLPPDERSATAGGNGVFGEDPVQPGSYDTTSAPTTRPSNAVSR